MIEEIILTPRSSFTELGIEIVCTKSMHTVVRLYNASTGAIIKMMGWGLLAGANLTSLHPLNLSDGTYRVVVLDQEGELLSYKDIDKITTVTIPPA